MTSEYNMEEHKMENFRETMDRLTAASHVQIDYFAEHKKIEGYYTNLSEGQFFKCDRLMKQENMFGRIQLGYNPNRKRVFLFANLKTSRYDTVASKYQKEMHEYQRRSLLKGNNENRAYVSKRRENATVLIEKKENKPWTQRSVKTYLKRANAEAVSKTLPFFSKEEEKRELEEVRTAQKAVQENISELFRDMASEQEAEEKNRKMQEKMLASHRKIAMKNLEKENLLEAIIIRKNAAEKAFLRKINYAYDFQKKDIEDYYRDKYKEITSAVENIGAEDDKPEDKDE